MGEQQQGYAIKGQSELHCDGDVLPERNAVECEDRNSSEPAGQDANKQPHVNGEIPAKDPAVQREGCVIAMTVFRRFLRCLKGDRSIGARLVYGRSRPVSRGGPHAPDGNRCQDSEEPSGVMTSLPLA